MNFRVKRDVNDGLYSDIIRLGNPQCWRCDRERQLDACHIMKRGHYTTRFMLKPVKNAVPLCRGCHDWFDKHQIPALIFDVKKRVLTEHDESFTFLVEICGYTWENLQYLKIQSQLTFRGYKWKKKEITKHLRLELNGMR